jgi:hypothetical protein
MTQQYNHQYILALGRINNEHLYARKHGPTVYVLTNQPPGILGYTIPEPERRRGVQRTIDEYLNDTKVQPSRHEQKRQY